MRLSKLEFASLLSYSTKGTSDQELNSKNWRNIIKNDHYVSSKSETLLASNLVAELIAQNIHKLDFADFFSTNTLLVPIPSSSLLKSGSLWVPQRLAVALSQKGLGKTNDCLIRTKPLPRASTSLAENRPKAIDHFNTLAVNAILSNPSEILLVDDVITRGATSLGAANRLAEAFPNAKIRVFVAMRAVSPPDKFVDVYDPRKGIVELVGSNTYRRP